MRTSPSAVSKIAEFEGCRLAPYNDLAGNATVGIGHLLHRGPLDGTEVPVTREEALRVFAQDLLPREKTVSSYVRVPLTQNQFDSLVSFTYNLGAGNLLNLLSETGLNRGCYDKVPLGMVEYNKAHINGILTVVPGLARRRVWEAKLFGTPDA